MANTERKTCFRMHSMSNETVFFLCHCHLLLLFFAVLRSVVHYRIYRIRLQESTYMYWPCIEYVAKEVKQRKLNDIMVNVVVR